MNDVLEVPKSAVPATFSDKDLSDMESYIRAKLQKEKEIEDRVRRENPFTANNKVDNGTIEEGQALLRLMATAPQIEDWAKVYDPVERARIELLAIERKRPFIHYPEGIDKAVIRLKKIIAAGDSD